MYLVTKLCLAPSPCKSPTLIIMLCRWERPTFHKPYWWTFDRSWVSQIFASTYSNTSTSFFHNLHLPGTPLDDDSYLFSWVCTFCRLLCQYWDIRWFPFPLYVFSNLFSRHLLYPFRFRNPKIPIWGWNEDNQLIVILASISNGSLICSFKHTSRIMQGFSHQQSHLLLSDHPIV